MDDLIFENLKIQQNIDFGKMTTMKLGGIARFFVVVKSVDDFRTALRFSKEQNLPIFILGGGSNTIVKTEKFAGLVIKNEILGFEKVFENDEKVEFKINSGENWNEFVRSSVFKNLSGCEAMVMIPGTVGALPIQNVGAYGQEIADILKSVEVFEIKTGEIKNLSKAECNFLYRDSIFKNDKKSEFFILAINVELSKNAPKFPEYKNLREKLKKSGKNEDNLTAKDVMDAVVEIRSQKLPDPEVVANSGSFFKNAIISKEKASELRKKYENVPLFEFGDKYKIATGWLIDRAGLKGQEIAGFRIYTENALVLTNVSAENYEDLVVAREEIQRVVEQKFGIKIEQEPLEI